MVLITQAFDRLHDAQTTAQLDSGRIVPLVTIPLYALLKIVAYAWECRNRQARAARRLARLIHWLIRLAEAKKQFEPLINRRELARRHLPEEAPDAALVDRSEMIDEGVGRLRQPARPW